jgi:carbonic anhydrase
VLFVACCDSRVVPNTFASSDPGDLFVLRNIGNIIPCSYHHDISVAATIEFSLLSLGVQDIIVCGHSDCGAMQTLIENASISANSPSSLNLWLKYAASSYERFKNSALKNTGLSPCNLLSRINVLQQIDNLKTYPLVMERLQNKKLRIHGWWFDLATADVYYYNEKRAEFTLIDEKEQRNILSFLD